jgi:hypothetical protein
MKTSSKLTLSLTCATVCLVLGACGDGSVPAAKDVEVRQPSGTPVDAPGSKFKGSFGSTDTPDNSAGEKKPDGEN